MTAQPTSNILKSNNNGENNRQGEQASCNGTPREPFVSLTSDDGAGGSGDEHSTRHASQHTDDEGMPRPGSALAPSDPGEPNSSRQGNRASDTPSQAAQTPPGTPPISLLHSDGPNIMGTPYRPYANLPRTSAANTRKTPNSKKRTRAHLTVASENMRGRGNPKIAGSRKWQKLADTIRSEKIGVMAIQETHLLPEHLQEIKLLHKHLEVFNTADPDNPSGAGGVALVFNNFVTNTKDIESTVIVPGRAIMTTFNWHKDDELSILAIYAPNNARESADLWETIHEKIRTSRGRIPKPDVILGDMNFVEDNVDRFPVATHHIDKQDKFDALKQYCKVKDGWRATNPSTVAFTWRDASRSSMSRIDRIYVTEPLLQTSRNWKIELSDLNRDDHSRVSVELVNLDMPEIGAGRWTMRETLTHDKEFMEAVDEAGKRARERLENIEKVGRTEEENPQIVHADFKRTVTRVAKQRTRDINCRRNTKVEKLKQACTLALDAHTSDPSEQTKAALRDAEHELQRTLETNSDGTRAQRRAKNWVANETVSKTWLSWAKENKPRDTMTSLENPNATDRRFETSTSGMAEIAAQYHDGLQQKDIHPDPAEREAAIQRALDTITPDPKTRTSPLADRISAPDVENALKASQNGKAAGLDGLIYELWKALKRRHDDSKSSETPSFDIIHHLTTLYQDIEEHGLIEGSNFAEGWMCPFYKKGERTNIANYRPITLLNTDYKIYTKALAMKLADAAPSMIHESQAGFMRGRSITNHAKITALLTDYAEATEENGVIVCLDQEKAYDKVSHDYLLRVLKRFNLPERFIRAVETLYSQAYTAVMINGTLSRAFKVTRGVRQGDPLSCLLFNLAIEPLSAMLRNSGIQGYDIPGLRDKLVASLYADDTTVYLRDSDSYSTLLEILKTWQIAAGARFNVAKTEIIPLGTPDFRRTLIDSRKLNNDDIPIPANIRIARDQEATRVIGTWLGNRVDAPGIWTPILEKTTTKLEQWNKMNPSIEGLSTLAQIYIGGYTQYLTAAQGMPPEIEKKVEKLTVDFIWGKTKRHPINIATLRKPKDNGGKNLFHAGTRNEAAYIVWLRDYLKEPGERPTWAYIADVILALNIRATEATQVPLDTRYNPIVQHWKPNARKLPFILKQLIKVSTKYGVLPDAPYVPESVRLEIPIWSHLARTRPNQGHHTKEARCLRKNHHIYLVNGLDEIAEQDESDHNRETDCECANCTADRAEGCKAPYLCQEYARELLAEIAPKWNTDTAQYDDRLALTNAERAQWPTQLAEEEALNFDPTPNHSEKLSDYMRVFTNNIGLNPAPPTEIAKRDAGIREWHRTAPDSVHAYACGSCLFGRSAKAQGGFAVHFAYGEAEDISSKSPGPIQTEERSAILAILHTVNTVPQNATLHIICNNKRAVERLTTRKDAHEDIGWTDVPDVANPIRHTIALMRRRSARTTLTYISKHRNGWSELKDTVKKARAAARATPEILEPNVAEAVPYDIPGAKLLTMTQKRAHRIIKAIEATKTTDRRATSAGIKTAQDAVEATNGTRPTEKQIWTSTRSRDIPKNVQNFLWKGIHGAHKVGDYFSNMPMPWKEYATCPLCNVTESMEHILFTCRDPARKTIWRLAKHCLETKTGEPVEINIGTVWGCAAMHFEDEEQTKAEGKARAFRIITSESAFLIWKIRCERRIQHENDRNWKVEPHEATNRWKAAINNRIATDRLLTNKTRHKRGALRTQTVLSTWCDILENEESLERDWIRHPGVLVGIGTSRIGNRGDG